MSIVIYTQYCCCVNQETRLNFTAHFGYLIPMLVLLLVGELTLVIAATGIVMSINLPPAISFICLVATIITLGGTIGLVVWIPMWNQAHNYIDHVSAAATTYEAPVPLGERPTTSAAGKNE
jgi:hypothetical protein